MEPENDPDPVAAFEILNSMIKMPTRHQLDAADAPLGSGRLVWCLHPADGTSTNVTDGLKLQRRGF